MYSYRYLHANSSMMTSASVPTRYYFLRRAVKYNALSVARRQTGPRRYHDNDTVKQYFIYRVVRGSYSVVTLSILETCVNIHIYIYYFHVYLYTPTFTMSVSKDSRQTVFGIFSFSTILKVYKIKFKLVRFELLKPE